MSHRGLLAALQYFGPRSRSARQASLQQPLFTAQSEESGDPAVDTEGPVPLSPDGPGSCKFDGLGLQTSDVEPQGAFCPSSLVMHAIVVAALALSDGLDFLQRDKHQKDAQASTVGLALLLLYVLLEGLLLLTELLRRSRGSPRSPPWLLLALLQAGLCVAAAQRRPPALTLGLLQLATAALYPCGPAAAILTSCVSVAAVLAQAAAQPPRAAAETLDGLLLLAAVGFVCAKASKGRWPDSLRTELLDGLKGHGCDAGGMTVCVDLQDMRETLGPLLRDWSASPLVEDRPLVGTRLDHLVSQLAAAVQNVSACAALPAELRELLADALQRVWRTLRRSTSLKKIPTRALIGLDRTSETVQYVTRVLNQDDRAVHYAARAPEDRAEPNLQAEQAWSQRVEGIAAEALAAIAAPAQADEGSLGGGPEPSPAVSALLSSQTGTFCFDVFSFAALSARPLTAWGQFALGKFQDGAVDASRLHAFLGGLEDRYVRGNLYHNDLHAVAVANSLLYLLNLSSPPLAGLGGFEKLTALAVGLAHDVGHTGTSNRFHTLTQTPLALLFNDQSVLENMHAATMFAVMRTEAADFLAAADAVQRALFRGLAVQMILDTDISRHVQLMSQFRQEFQEPAGRLEPLGAPQKKGLLSMLLKCADVGSSAMAFPLHPQWTLRIVSEFYLQGDAERAMGMPCSPFCDRYGEKLLESQHGFLDFICIPMFTAVGDYIQSQRLTFEVLENLRSNRQFWREFRAEAFTYSDPMASVELLNSAHRSFKRETRGQRLPSHHFASTPLKPANGSK